MNEKDELFISIEKDYGNQYKDHVLEQYKLYLESVEKNSDRRQKANSYFLTINTALLTVLGLTFQFGNYSSRIGVRVALAIAGVVIAIIFHYLIKSYKQLGTGKFAVIHKIEERLPLSLYKYEWEVLGNGEDKEKYFPFSHIERYIPLCFGLGYFFMLLYVVWICIS